MSLMIQSEVCTAKIMLNHCTEDVILTKHVVYAELFIRESSSFTDEQRNVILYLRHSNYINDSINNAVKFKV